MPLSELAVPNRIVGERQVKKALKEGSLAKLFIAEDANWNRIGSVVNMAQEYGLEIEIASSMQILGRACAISRGASVAGVAKI